MKEKRSVELPKKSLFSNLPDPAGTPKRRRGLPSKVESTNAETKHKRRKQLFY